MSERILAGCGIVVMILLAMLLSKNRKAIDWRLVVWSIVLQFMFALLILKTQLGKEVFQAINLVFLAIAEMGKEGARFLVGDLADSLFAFRVLPTILVYAGVMAVLYYLGIMQLVIGALAWVMQKTLRISPEECLAAAANVFIGQSEAPLVVKPFVPKMTESQLLALLTGGLATVAGGVMAACVSMLSEDVPNIGGHMMAASIMSAPASLLFAKLMIPETGKPLTSNIREAFRTLKEEAGEGPANVLHAYSDGVIDGGSMVLRIAFILVAFVGPVVVINTYWSRGAQLLSEQYGADVSRVDTLQKTAGHAFLPFAYLMGIRHEDALEASTYLAEKTLLNEFVAYGRLAAHLKAARTDSSLHQFDQRSVEILSYALCGFANILSLGILIAAIGYIAPTRQPDVCRIIGLALVGGTFACFQTACIAGLLL